MAEAWEYRREDITDQNGNVIDSALFRVPRNGARGEVTGVIGGGFGGGNGAAANPWENAQYRGASRGGRVHQYIRSAAGRGAARNPAMRNNRYGI